MTLSVVDATHRRFKEPPAPVEATARRHVVQFPERPDRGSDLVVAVFDPGKASWRIERRGPSWAVARTFNTFALEMDGSTFAHPLDLSTTGAEDLTHWPVTPTFSVLAPEGREPWQAGYWNVGEYSVASGRARVSPSGRFHVRTLPDRLGLTGRENDLPSREERQRMAVQPITHCRWIRHDQALPEIFGDFLDVAPRLAPLGRF